MTLLARYQDQPLSLAALCDAAGVILAAAGVAPADDRVAALPDPRTVRYYQQLGIVDRPVRYDGRQAIYGYRSLLQAVAVKLLQGQGSSLAQVQGALAGRSTTRLEAAILDAIGGGPGPVLPRAPEPVVLLSVEVAPGVVVTVDPRVVTDPQAVVDRVRASLTPGGSS